MPATATAAIAAFEMVFFGKTFVAFGRVIEIFAFNRFIFVILSLHRYKFKTLVGMLLIVSKYLLPKGYRGITLFPFVIVREKKDSKDQVVINHERIHLRQQLEMLVLLFYLVYFLDFIVQIIRYRNKYEAYRNICFEREAYENEKDLDYLKSRPFWRFLKYC